MWYVGGLDMVQPWAELDVAGVDLSFANWMAANSPHSIRVDA